MKGLGMRHSMTRVGVLWLILPAVLAAFPVRAEVASAGLAGAYMLRARGVDAPAWNPATLAWDGGTDVRLFSVEASARNNSFSLRDYNRWNGEVWSESDKKEIFDRIPGSSFEGGFLGSVEGPGTAWRGWALTTGTYATGAVRVPREFARLVLYGNTPEESFDLSGAGGDALAWSELRLSYGRTVREAAGPLGSLAVGASVKALRGWGYAEVLDASGGFVTGMDGIHGEAFVRSRTSTGASGFGLDLGAVARGPGGWDLGLCLRNALSTLRWSRDPREQTEEAVADTITLQNVQDNEDIVATHSVKTPVASFRRSLPATLTLAAGRALGRSYVEADLRQGFSDRAGTSTTPRLAVGVSRSQWRWVTGRLGLAAGGEEGKVCAAGLGFAVWKIRLDLSASAVGSWNPFAPRGVGAGVSLGMRWM